MDSAIKHSDPIAKLEKILVDGLNQKLGTRFSNAEDAARYMDAKAEETPRRKSA